MATLRQQQTRSFALPHTSQVMWVAVSMAALAALSYILMKAGWLGIGSLQMAPDESIIIDVAAGGYLLGGILILLRMRWLWIIGALINGMVLLFYFSMYAQRPDVLLSAGGLSSKVMQIVLEAALLYLIVWAGRRRLTN